MATSFVDNMKATQPQPKFDIGQQAVVTLQGVERPCRIFSREPGEHARGFVGVSWVYHVVPEGLTFGVNVAEEALRPT